MVSTTRSDTAGTDSPSRTGVKPVSHKEDPMKSFTVILPLMAAVSVAATAFGHERREIAGMQVVFGGEPEPVFDGEICFLRWRFADLESKEPVADLEDAKATNRDSVSPKNAIAGSSRVRSPIQPETAENRRRLLPAGHLPWRVGFVPDRGSAIVKAGTRLETSVTSSRPSVTKRNVQADSWCQPSLTLPRTVVPCKARTCPPSPLARTPADNRR